MAKRILFVCLGNICRSPLADGIMRHLKKQKQLDLLVDSAGTANYHMGEAPDPRTVANARKNGVDLSTLRARQFSTEDFYNFDYIFVMDKSNLAYVLKLTKNVEYKAKVHLFLEFTTGDLGKEVPDPYYGTEKDFEEVFHLVYSSCELLLKKLM